MAARIGLTGGIGCGKSTVCRLFRELGIDTISADDIAHELMTAGTPQYAKIVEHFMEKFNFSASAIIRVEYGMHVRKADTIELITSKKLAFRDIEATKSKLNHLRECLSLLPEYNEKIIGALSLLMQHERYDENVMIKKLKQVGGNLKPSSSQKHYTEQFQRFYNHGTRSRRIYFL